MKDIYAEMENAPPLQEKKTIHATRTRIARTTTAVHMKMAMMFAGHILKKGTPVATRLSCHPDFLPTSQENSSRTPDVVNVHV